MSAETDRELIKTACGKSVKSEGGRIIEQGEKRIAG